MDVFLKYKPVANAHEHTRNAFHHVITRDIHVFNGHLDACSQCGNGMAQCPIGILIKRVTKKKKTAYIHGYPHCFSKV